jgi:PAS domain S-box-containing protein
MNRIVPERYMSVKKKSLTKGNTKATGTSKKAADRSLKAGIPTSGSQKLKSQPRKKADERRQEEEKLKQSLSLLKATLESTADGILVVANNGKITDFNKQFAKLWGIPKTILDLHDDKKAVDFVLDQLNNPEQFIDRVRELYAHPEDTSFDVLEFKDGRIFERYSQPQKIDGKPVGRVWSFRDVTEHKKAEDALRRSEEKFFKAFHSTPDAIVISRASDGLLLEVNDVFLQNAGYSREETLNRTTEELNLWVDINDRERYITAMKSMGRARDIEVRFRTKSGKLLDGLMSGESILLGDEPCLLTIIRDITERVKTEAELEKYRLHLEDLVNERTKELEQSQLALQQLLVDVNEANKNLAAANEKLKEIDRLKSMFIASMSHELRTPLNSIIGFSSILLNQWKGPLNDNQQLMLSTVFRSGRHLLSLINDVIDVSKIEAGMIEVHIEEFDLQDVISEAVELINKDITDKKLELKIESLHLAMTTERRRLLQCVLNFLSNAVKFTTEGSVKLAVRPVTGAGDIEYIEITVEDTGIGIKKEDMTKLFQAFSRLDSPLRATVLGTGLGLYLTKKLVTEVLKGEIIVNSEYGKGSRFVMKLPMVMEES